MRDVAVELRSLDQIATLLVNQQSCRAGTNPGTPLPSVSAVMTIVRELRNVLFPGIHSHEFVTPLPGVTGIRLQLAPLEKRLRR